MSGLIEFFDMQNYGHLLFEGLQVNIVVGLFSLVAAIAIGLLGSWMKLAPSKGVRLVADTYTTVVRGVPELVQILLIYYGLPTLIQRLSAASGAPISINLDPFVAGVATLGVIYGAFTTEVFRGAYLAVPKGQIEAAQACGMNRALLFRRVLFPQMLRYALPGLGNIWLILIKATALISVIQLPEMVRKGEIINGAIRKPFTVYLSVAFLFLAITVVSMIAQRLLERWANKGVARRA